MKVASMPALIHVFLSFVATSLATSEQAFPASPGEATVSLQSSLAAGSLEKPQVLSGILRELGLPSLQDVWLLSVAEQLELADFCVGRGSTLARGASCGGCLRTVRRRLAC
jgi:hypothetical protein